MSFLDGSLASAFASAFGGMYLDGTLIKTTEAHAIGGDVTVTTCEVPCKVQIDRVTEAQRSDPTFTQAEVRVFVLRGSLCGESVLSSDKVRADAGPYAGILWSLLAPISTDPAGLAYDCAGVRG